MLNTGLSQLCLDFHFLMMIHLASKITIETLFVLLTCTSSSFHNLETHHLGQGYRLVCNVIKT